MAKRPTPPTSPKAAKPPGQRDPAKVWQERLTASDKAYDAWSKEYDCPRLDKYYRGKHWAGLSEDEAAKKYVINLIFATVETQLPTLMFSQPKVKAEARPDHQETAGSDASNRATLIEQTLQTFIDDPKLFFNFETTLALRAAYKRFGLVEVGYSADYIDNPNAGKPVLNEKEEPMKGDDDQVVVQPPRIRKPGTKESLYLRHVPPNTFRASPGRNRLEANDWVAYYEWHYLDDVKRNPEYSNTHDVTATGRIVTVSDDTTTDDPDRERHVGMVKVWKIFDLRLKVRHVHADGHKKLLQENKPFSALMLADLKFFELEEQYYPLPPLYNWISPQDEINESREMRKLHRRRAVRRYMREPSVKKEEFEKLETGVDMACIEVPKVNPSPIMPIPDAPLDSQQWQHDASTRDDFLQITGVSGEARGAPESTTATQANIVNIKAQIRESHARNQVAEWLGKICRLMLIAIREKMQLPFMVKRSVDPFAFGGDPNDLASSVKGWQEIKAEDIDNLDVDIKIDVTSLSPVAEDAARNAWNVVLQLLTNQALLMILMTPNPAAPQEPSTLLRKTLALNGVKSDQEVREIWRVGQVVMERMVMMQMAAMAAKGGGGAPGLGGGGGPGGLSLAGSPGANTGTPAAPAGLGA